jgi:hypothetical protein
MATLYGDTAGSLIWRQKGKFDFLVGADNESNWIYGDAGVALIDRAQGTP